jgi:hypothetical protein
MLLDKRHWHYNWRDSGSLGLGPGHWRMGRISVNISVCDASYRLAIVSGIERSSQTGIALHPYFEALLPTLDDLQGGLPQNDLVPFLLNPTTIVPSTTYLQHDYPISLPLYLTSLIPPPRDPSIYSQDDLLGSSQATIKGLDKTKDQDSSGGQNSSNFLNMQAMDVRKWNWGGVLNFGRSSAKTSPQGTSVTNSGAGTVSTSTAASSRRGSVDQSEPPSVSSSGGDKDVGGGEKKESDERRESVSTSDLDADKRSIVESIVDLSALDDAISSKVSPVPSVTERSTGGSSITPGASPLPTEDSGNKAVDSSASEQRLSDDHGGADEEIGEEVEKKTIREPEIITPKALPAFLRKTMHLQDGHDPLVTTQRKVYFLLVCSCYLTLRVSTD